MHFEEAFSTQAGRTVTADRAYELFWAGIIYDKRAFRCPGEGCSAQITCANMDVIEHDLKVQPHFRLYGQHAAGCPFDRERSEASTGRLGSRSGSPGTYQLSQADVFQLNRPADHFVRTTSATPPGGRVATRPASRIRTTSVAEARQRKFYSVGTLVSRWLALRSEGRLADSQIQIGNLATTYERLFRGVYNQDAQSLEGVSHIYWGKAWVERMQSGKGFRLRFNENFKVDDRACRPTLWIYDDKLEKYDLKKLLQSRLNAAIEKSKGACVLFVYGAPVVAHDLDSATSTAPYTRSFVNFKMPNLDLLEVRGLDLFEQLRQKT